MGESRFGVVAKLVWDGGDEVRIPDEMGAPAENQMRGTAGERLTELAGRACYDSLGRGRSSADYHAHILQVGHYSVAEHFHLTVKTSIKVNSWVVLNRPGIWTRHSSWCRETRLTYNPRVVLDWDRWSRESDVEDFVADPGSLGNLLSHHAERLCPMVVAPRTRLTGDSVTFSERSAVAPPEHHEEKWISLFMAGSRGWSHEMVRHRFRTGVSQRSTRYVDEDGSPWVDHPLVQEYSGLNGGSADVMLSMAESAKVAARSAYKDVSGKLQDWLMSRGVDKLTARRQARGAARGYLGNALWTEMVFSASVAQWKRMLRLRCTASADAEIRAVFAEALPVLQSSRYGDDFSSFRLEPSPDGIGEIAVEAPEK